jgi:hypothetical protein
MKKKTNYLIFGIIIVLIVGGIYFASSKNQNFAVLTSPYIEVPVFGWYSCESSGSSINIPYQSVDSQSYITQSGIKWYKFTCNDFAESDGCKITLEIPSESLTTFNTGIRYTTCQTNNFCTSNIVEKVRLVGGDRETFTVQLSGSEYLFASYQQDAWGAFTSPKNRGGMKFSGSITPYFLYRTDIYNGGKTLTNQKNCGIDSTIQTNFGEVILTTTIKTLTGTVGTNPTHVDKSVPYNYITGFSPVATANLMFQTYNGKTAQCRNNALYSIEEVKTAYGTYQVVNTNLQQQLTTVTCCNNDERPGYKCVDNKWVSQSVVSECSAFNPCPASSSWQYDSTKQNSIYIYDCVNSKCVLSTKTVSCQPGVNNGCASGEVCKIDLYNPNNIKCEKVIAGNDDLPPISGEGKTNYIVFIISLILGFGLGVLTYIQLKKYISNQYVLGIVSIIAALLGWLLIAAIIKALFGVN